MSMEDVLAYVDNFFDIMPPCTSVHHRQLRRGKIEGMFHEAGVALHEHQEGTQFKGLGWIWDTEKMEMRCPNDKFTVLCDYLKKWNASTSMSLSDLETATGMMYWLGAGFTMGAACVGHLIHDRTKGQAMHTRSARPKSAVMVRVSREAQAALRFWGDFFPTWNKRCPIFAGFSPVTTFEVLGRVDASTEWGCGGFAYDVATGELHGFCHEWTAEERKKAHVAVRESTGVMEAMGARIWLEVLGPTCRNRRLQLELDNSSVTRALGSLYSPTPPLMLEVVDAATICCELRVCLRVRHVTGDVFNQIADRLSHNDIPQARCLAVKEFGTPLLLLKQ